jgi:nitroreductase
MSSNIVQARAEGTPAAPPADAPRPVLHRRKLLGLAGAGTLVLIVGGVIGRAADQGVFSTNTGPAYDAWRTWDWDLPGGDNVDLVRAAILAANAHDSQPWVFRLAPARIDLYADTARNLGSIDPLLREMHLSLGCALENLLIAAQARGLSPALTLRPDPADVTHVARVDLSPEQPGVSPLYAAIPRRHTDRGPYDTNRSVAAQTLAAMAVLIDEPDIGVVWFTSDADKKTFAELTVSATAAFIADSQQAADDFAWYRNDWHQLQAAKDGITVDASGISPLVRAVAKIAPVSREQDDQGWLDNTRNVQVATAAAFGTMVARDKHDLVQRIKAGRIWQRMHLWATTQGLAVQPLNQVVERAERERAAGLEPELGRALAALVPDPDREALMPFRIGYPTAKALASPRRPAEEVIRAG